MSSPVVGDEVALVAAERVVPGDLDQDDAHPVRVLDPHLVEAPHLPLRFAHDAHAGGHETVMLGADVADLEPQRDRLTRRCGRPSADLEQAVAEEEHQPGGVRVAELPVDGQAQHVPVEPLAAGRVGGAEQDAAAEDLHAPMIHLRGCPQVRFQPVANVGGRAYVRLMDHFSGADPAHPLRRMAAEAAALVKEVADVDPVFMSPADKTAALTELTHLQDQLRLIELGLARACQDLASDEGFRDVASWRQAREHRDGRAARREERLAEALVERWVATAAAVRLGRVSLEQVGSIVRSLDRLVDALEAELSEMADACTRMEEVEAIERAREWIDEVVARAESQLIELAADHTPRELDRLGESILTVVAPDHADELERRALERAERRARSVTRLGLRARGDGTTRITGVIPDVAATMLTTYLGALTSPRLSAGATSASGEDPRTVVDPWIDPATGRRIPQEQRWGQAFVALLERVTTRDVPQHGGLGASVVVTIDFESLRAGVGHGTIGDPDGDGARLSAGEVRRLACASGLLPAVLGSDSVPLDLGRTSRLFSGGQRKAHAVSHPTCEASGCSVPAAWCESHHKRDPWAGGGTTDRADLAFLCPWHHHRAHDPGYRATWPPGGGVVIHRRT